MAKPRALPWAVLVVALWAERRKLEQTLCALWDKPYTPDSVLGERTADRRSGVHTILQRLVTVLAFQSKPGLKGRE
jgi:hypothetical protein